MFEAALREATRILSEHTEKLQREQLVRDGEFDEVVHRSIAARVGVLLHRMSDELSRECERLGAWGVLGQATGARLVRPTDSHPMAIHELIGQ